MKLIQLFMSHFAGRRCFVSGCVFVFLTVGLVRCDMGTYQQRLEERIDDLRENDLPENRDPGTTDSDERP